MKVLHIDSSIMGDASVSRQLSQAIVTQLKAKHNNAQVEYLDLAQQTIPHLTAEILMGKNVEQTALSEKLIQQYLDADVVVIGAAMYIAGDKKAYIASSRGGVYGENSPVDFQEGMLKTVFGFTGVNDVDVIRAEGVNMGAEMKDKAMADAMAKIQVI